MYSHSRDTMTTNTYTSSKQRLICSESWLTQQRHNDIKTYTSSKQRLICSESWLPPSCCAACVQRSQCLQQPAAKVKHVGEESICQQRMTDDACCGMQRNFWRTLLPELAMKPRQLLGMGACSLRSMWSRPGTLKCRFWLTTMGMWCTCMRGTAQCSGATRR